MRLMLVIIQPNDALIRCKVKEKKIVTQKRKNQFFLSINKGKIKYE
jgi:hypothetical protein